MARDNKSERSLSSNDLQRILDTVADVVILLDSQSRVVWFERSAKTTFGWKRNRVVGREINRLYPFSKVQLPFDHALEGVPLCLPMRSGETRCFRLEVVPFSKRRQLLLLSEHGKQLQTEIRQREFVVNASHELRTPLTILGGYLEQLVSQEGPGEWRRPLEVMSLQSERMRQIVDDMLLLSGLEQAGERAYQESVNVPELLYELADSYSILIKKRQQRFNLDVDQHLWLRGATDVLRSAFSNLMVNAIKYTQKGGTITIHWQSVGEGAQFMVKDDGPGISAADQQRLTERFYRVDKGRSRELGGTGLGLSIVQGALQAHETTLLIKSELGKGSRFYAQFPENLSIVKR